MISFNNREQLKNQHTKRLHTQIIVEVTYVSTVPQSCGKSHMLAYLPHSRIFARTSRISGFISKHQKSMKIATETFCSKKLYENVNDSVTFGSKIRQKTLKIAIIFTVGYILVKKALRKRQ